MKQRIQLLEGFEVKMHTDPEAVHAGHAHTPNVVSFVKEMHTAFVAASLRASETVHSSFQAIIRCLGSAEARAVSMRSASA